MVDQYSRTRLLLGANGMDRLRRARVIVFGIGGVGGYTVEALARSGIGALDLVDDDRVCLTNLNRQLIATHDTLGQYKADAAAARIHSIDPSIRVTLHKTFYTPETDAQFDFSQYDYIVDAIDTVTGKLRLVERAHEVGVPIISVMGAGNKMDATAFEVTDISRTTFCPLARVMRKELKKRGITHLKVVYSREPARTPLAEEIEPDEAAQSTTREGSTARRQTPGSNAFVPAVAGLIAAGEVIQDLTEGQE